MMAIYYVIVILAGALALVSFAAGAIGILGSIGAIHLERCPRCSRHLIAADGSTGAAGTVDQKGCFFCRHVNVAHPLEALHHSHAHTPVGRP